MAAAPWPRVKQVTLADQAYSAIRTRIVSGALAAGEFVREQDVSEALGVSRTPVREALGRLASEGFLERIPHRGFRVPSEPLGRLIALYPILSALELLAGRLAFPSLDAEDIAELRGINIELATTAGGDDVARRIDLNNAFHGMIADRSGNPRLIEMLDDLRQQVSRLELWYYSQGSRTDESVAQHEEMLSALEVGDFERALGLFERNMTLTLERFSEDA